MKTLKEIRDQAMQCDSTDPSEVMGVLIDLIEYVDQSERNHNSTISKIVTVIERHLGRFS